MLERLRERCGIGIGQRAVGAHCAASRNVRRHDIECFWDKETYRWGVHGSTHASNDNRLLKGRPDGLEGAISTAARTNGQAQDRPEMWIMRSAKEYSTTETNGSRNKTVVVVVVVAKTDR